MNQYKKLLGNTMIFAIGTFSSKILVFLMTRYYTSVMTQEQFGEADLIIQTANIIIPIASIGIANAVIRYALDKAVDKRQVFSIGIFTVLIGFVCILPFAPLLYRIEFIGTNLFLIYAYVLISSLQAVCAQFIRGLGHVRLYALNGILRTVLVIAFNILFLSGVKIGVQGYVLSVVCSDAIAIVVLFAVENLGQYLHREAFDRDICHQMFRYSLPLVPTAICAWIFSVSDRYFVLYFCGKAMNGLYATSYKIPTVLTLVSTIFIDAWQLSTVNDNTKEEQIEFFSKVGNTYQAILFLIASGIVMTSKLAIYLLAAPSYYSCWRYVPILIVGTAFYSLSNFLNSIYMLYKKTVFSSFSAISCAVLNLILNATLIPVYGANGASVATLISYFLMFFIRAIHSRQLLVVHWKIKRFVATCILIGVQIVLMLREGPYWFPIQAAFFLSICALNAGDILLGIKKLFRKA